VKTLITAVIATLMLASGVVAAPGGSSDFYPVGHESYTGTGQELAQ
jgi:hypothetical protein